MPIKFNDESLRLEDGIYVKHDSTIVTDEGKKIGKYRNGLGKIGLAVLRIEDAFKAKKIIHQESGLEITTWKPHWWPKEMSRDDSVSIEN